MNIFKKILDFKSSYIKIKALITLTYIDLCSNIVYSC